MASKRRNMFHKNKTQETTEKGNPFIDVQPKFTMLDGEIREYLETTQNPFQWELDTLTSGFKKASVIGRLQEKCETSGRYEYRRFCIKIALAHQFALKDDWTEANKSLDQCQQLLSIDDRLMMTYKCALEHILNATRAYIAYLSGDKENALKQIQKLGTSGGVFIMVTAGSDANQSTTATTRSLLGSVKDPLPMKTSRVYEIPCCCGETCIGQTGRLISIRVQEHIRATKNNDMKLAVAEHSMETCHLIEFEKTRIVASVPRYKNRAIDSISSFDTMDQGQQAAVWATRANITLGYFFEGTIKSLEYAKKAVELNNLEPEWHLVVGKIMARIRHNNFPSPLPSEDEIHHLELGFKMEKTATFAVYLGRVYSDFATSTFNLYYESKSKRDLAIVEDYRHKAYNAYMQSIELNTAGCPLVMIRCARGIMKLPMNHKCRPVVVNLMNKALENAPHDPVVNHYSGLIYKKLKQIIFFKYAEALKCLEAAVNVGNLVAAFTLIEVRSMLDSQFSPEKYYEQLLDDFGEKPIDRAKIYFNSAVYELFKKRNFESAIFPFTEALKLEPTLEGFKSCWPIWIDVKKPVNLLLLFANDAKYRKAHSKGATLLNTQLDFLLETIGQVDPDVIPKLTPTHEMFPHILSEEFNQRASNSSRGRGMSTGRRPVMKKPMVTYGFDIGGSCSGNLVVPGDARARVHSP
ncbi:hypothetical protein AAG570_010549 [Ranatra chinensis]|uniref:Uncharacterized protein n=1 Tax=Ranatra chinensis TaxID=642074 RepID=A0ABD0YYV2_9HEMI